MPFEAATFDAAYTQHVAMNIEAKPALYAEIARVLKAGARFGIYDILQGPGGEAIYPTPWANDRSTSFLATPDELRRLLETAGFQIESWRDTTAAARVFFETALARSAGRGPPPLGLHLLLPDFRPRARECAARPRGRPARRGRDHLPQGVSRAVEALLEKARGGEKRWVRLPASR